MSSKAFIFFMIIIIIALSFVGWYFLEMHLKFLSNQDLEDMDSYVQVSTGENSCAIQGSQETGVDYFLNWCKKKTRMFMAVGQAILNQSN